MKIVVTGALGHIGSRLIRELPGFFPDTELVMIDNMSTLRYCSLFNLPAAARYTFVEGDVLKMDLSPLLDGAHVVVHLAAITDAAGSFKNKEQVEHVNYNGASKVALACEKAGVAMIHLSSTSVYGTQKEVVDEDCSIEELKPQSPYAETKLREEALVQKLHTENKGRFVICRFGTICGMSAGMRFHTAVNKFCWQAIMGQPLTVWKTAIDQKRPYLTLDDAVRAIGFIIQNNLFDGKVYNVLTDNMTVRGIVTLIEKHLGRKILINFVDNAIMNQLSYEVLSLKFQDKGFEFQGTIEGSIKETIALLKNACSLDGK
jgi:nucleoside-diphosphate-sugar epimerase